MCTKMYIILASLGFCANVLAAPTTITSTPTTTPPTFTSTLMPASTSAPAPASTTTSTQHVWQDMANSICNSLNNAATTYLAGDVSEARTQASVGIETYRVQMAPPARQAINRARVSQMIQKFHTFYNNTLSTRPTPQKKQAAAQSAQSLCDEVRNDAKTMDSQNVPMPTAPSTYPHY